jgi:hypothetical protein
MGLPARVIVFVSLFLQGALVNAQRSATLHVDTIRAVQPWPPHEVYSFPRIVMPDRQPVADRINRHLCTDFLEVDPDTAGNGIFTAVWGDTVGWTTPRLSYLEWQVRRPLPDLLEVELGGEGCGAYCEGFTMRYQYDLREGRSLTHDELFTTPGLAALNDTLHRSWSKLLTGHIAHLVDSLADAEIEPGHVEFLQARMDLYRTCLEERPEGDPYVVDMVIEGDGIRFFLARCAPHAFLNLDELDPVSFALPWSWCVPRMRPEVRPLFP